MQMQRLQKRSQDDYPSGRLIAEDSRDTPRRLEFNYAFRRNVAWGTCNVQRTAPAEVTTIPKKLIIVNMIGIITI